ncbi:MAG TPA: HAD hydrolase family protein [Candidatus Saccharimonadales bacterium]|nr:HAD hydrolase family protein [Candidatus Saccharimonadales bacterium]
MKKYKALIADFDGTPAGHTGEITVAVKESIKELLNKKYIFSIATGRPYFGKIRSVCEEFNWYIHKLLTVEQKSEH